MLHEEDVVEIHALRRRGWAIAAIARHTGRDRKTIRRYLAGWKPKRGSGPEPARALPRLLSRPASPTTRTSSRQCCTASSSARLRALLPDPRPRDLRRLELRPPCECCRGGHDGQRPRSRTSPARSCSSTGSSCPRPRGGARPTCWSARSPTPGASAACSQRGPGLRPPGRRDRRTPAPLRRHCPQLAHRPDGHLRLPGHRPPPPRGRRARQALRGHGRDLPRRASAAQGRGRGRDRLPDPLLVERRRRSRRPARRRPPSTASRLGRRCSPARPATVGALAEREPLLAAAGGAVPAMLEVERGSIATPWSPSRATATAVGPSWPARR